jgi:hypothetical protein
MNYSPDLTQYAKTPQNDENPYQWAQTREVLDVKNKIEQIKLLHLANIQNIQQAEIKLFGASGSEENPSPLSVWHGYAQIPATAEWQMSRKMINNPKDLDLGKASRLVTVINTYRRLIQESEALINSFPKDLTEIKRFFPDEINNILAIQKQDVEKMNSLLAREMHFKRLLIDIKKNYDERGYSEKIAEPIGNLLKQVEAPISEHTSKVPHVIHERSFDDVRNALRPANDDVTRGDKPENKLAA